MLAALVAEQGPAELRVRDTPGGEQRLTVPTDGIGAAYQEGAQACWARDVAQ